MVIGAGMLKLQWMTVGRFLRCCWLNTQEDIQSIKILLQLFALASLMIFLIIKPNLCCL